MPSLQFTRDLALKILDGRKSQTLRGKLGAGFVTCRPLTLQSGYAKSGSVFGHARILFVDDRTCCSLSLDDAIRDGFDTLSALHTRLTEMNAPRELKLVRWCGFVPTKLGLKWLKAHETEASQLLEEDRRRFL